jgi:hypothetical protein
MSQAFQGKAKKLQLTFSRAMGTRNKLMNTATSGRNSTACSKQFESRCRGSHTAQFGSQTGQTHRRTPLPGRQHLGRVGPHVRRDRIPIHALCEDQECDTGTTGDRVWRWFDLDIRFDARLGGRDHGGAIGGCEGDGAEYEGGPTVSTVGKVGAEEGGDDGNNVGDYAGCQLEDS